MLQGYLPISGGNLSPYQGSLNGSDHFQSLIGRIVNFFDQVIGGDLFSRLGIKKHQVSVAARLQTPFLRVKPKDHGRGRAAGRDPLSQVDLALLDTKAVN